MDWKSRRNYKKSLTAQVIFAVVTYAKPCVRPYAFAGKYAWDERCCEWVPLVYHYDDHNGEYETYDIRKITNTTSASMYGWTFNKERADAWLYQHKILEEINYGKVFEN